MNRAALLFARDGAVALLVAAALALSSCAEAIVPRRVTFNEADFTRTRGTGSGSVVGRASTVEDGSPRFAQKIEIDLAPVNAYTTEVVKRRFEGGENLGPADPRYSKYLHSTQTDEHGNFEFRHIPPGDYYVVTKVSWIHDFTDLRLVGSADDNNYMPVQATQEISQWIYARVSVKNGQTVKVTNWNQGN
jgi:hypothetical protein